MQLKLLAAVAALVSSAASASPPLAPPPKLIVAIAVDQLSSDLWDEYRGQFTGGFARLARGAAFRNGYQSHAATETCPGHSTILTGAHPARNGIVANAWIDQSAPREDKEIYCAEDERVPGSSSDRYTVSPYHLMVPTIGELLKQARPGSRNVAVAGKDRAAVMMTGRRADQRLYWSNGRFVSDLSPTMVPQAAIRANAAVAAALSQPRPPLEPPAFCAMKAREIPIENREKSVGAGSFARDASDASALRGSPELDGATLALAAALLDEMQLGRRADPDVLAVSLSATDYVGHSYGTQGQEMCLQLLSLDRDLGDFFRLLDSRGLDYAVVLTSDHGGQDTPERRRLAGTVGAARTDVGLAARIMGRRLVERLGLRGVGLLGENSGDIYIDKSLSEADRKRLLGAALDAYRAHPQVEAVFTAAELAATPMPTTSPDQWTLIQRARASYYPGRSGDFVVLLKKDITPVTDTRRYIATHGSAWDYDRRVPILFWRAGMPSLALDTAVDTVDIAPTLAAMLGLAVPPGSFDGRCLDAVPGVVCIHP